MGRGNFEHTDEGEKPESTEKNAQESKLDDGEKQDLLSRMKESFSKAFQKPEEKKEAQEQEKSDPAQRMKDEKNAFQERLKASPEVVQRTNEVGAAAGKAQEARGGKRPEGGFDRGERADDQQSPSQWYREEMRENKQETEKKQEAEEDKETKEDKEAKDTEDTEENEDTDADTEDAEDTDAADDTDEDTEDTEDADDTEEEADRTEDGEKQLDDTERTEKKPEAAAEQPGSIKERLQNAFAGFAKKREGEKPEKQDVAKTEKPKTESFDDRYRVDQKTVDRTVRAGKEMHEKQKEAKRAERERDD